MPAEFGNAVIDSILINGETGPIGWSGIQTASTLLPEDYAEKHTNCTKWIDLDDLRHPLTFTCDLRLSEKFKRALIFGWRPKGPYRKRLIKKMEKAFPWHNFTFELRGDET